MAGEMAATDSSVRAAARHRLRIALLSATIAGGGGLPAVAQTTTGGGQGAGSGSVTLAPVTVQGDAPAGTIEAATTEGRDSYTTDTVTVGAKDPVPVRAVPQSLTVITRQRIEDQNMTQLEDAWRRTTGAMVATNDPGRSSLFLRGFEIDNYLVNGLPAPVSSIYGTQPDLAIFDRVEVLRGPTGLYGGSGEPGGTANLALKRAGKEFGASATGSVGSWENYRGEADVTGPLVESGRLRGRFVGAYQDRESFTDVVDNKVGIGYGAVEADVTEDTTVTIGVWRQERDITPFNGLPVSTTGKFLDIERSTFIGADWNRFDNSTTESVLELEHRFDGGGKAKLGMRVADREVDFKYAYGATAVNPAVGTTSMTAIARDYEETSLALDAHYSQPFRLLDRTHTATVGADYRRYEQTVLQGSASNFTAPMNVYDPNPDIAEPTITYTSRSEADPTQMGVYGQLRLKPVERVTTILGARTAWYESTVTNLVTGTSQSTEIDAEVVPYAGLVVDLTEHLSAYASYTDIFQPQTDLDASGSVIDPRSGTQYEIGLKASFMGGRFNASTGLFKLTDKDRALADPDSPGSFVNGGEVESRGFEAELSGRLLEGWEVFAGYAYTETEIIKAATTSQGQPFSTITPEHSFNVWSKYSFGEASGLDGFFVAGGARVVGSFYSQVGSTRIEEDGYVVVDAQVGYRLNENLVTSLTVNNLFDETYYSRVGGLGLFNFYGEPRSALLKVTASF